MENNDMNASQSLLIIEAMINKAKNRFSENGFLYLLWGWVIFICGIAQFVLIKLHNPHHPYVWMATWVTVIIQMIYLAKQKKRVRVKTYTDDIIKYVWIVFSVLLVMMIFLIQINLGVKNFYFINICFLALYGMPTTLSGVILKFKPLVLGGIGCWCIAIASSFIPTQYHPLLLSLAVIIAWIVPGYLLRIRYKKENV
jgi:membrane-associated HD superfamily phosphohydrolase